MPIQYINTGSSANAGNGDSIRLAFDKVNRNFKFVDTRIDALSDGLLNSLHIATTATTKDLSVTGTAYLNIVESATFINQTHFENITVSNTSTLNLVTANDAKIDTLEVLTSLSVGSYQIAQLNDYNDFSIIKNDANGLAVVLLNTNADSNSKLVVKDNISGGLVILHQNLTNLAGDFVPGESYIYGETPDDIIHIGAYSDIKISASQARYYDPTITETPSIVINSIDGSVDIYTTATFHNTVVGAGTGGTALGDRLTAGTTATLALLADGTLKLTHPTEWWSGAYSLEIQKATGNYHTFKSAYGLSLQATPVPNGYGLNTNTNFVDIFHDGVSVNVNDNTWGFGADGRLTLPNGSTIGDSDAVFGVPITTARGTIFLGNQAECGNVNHFHIMKAGQQDIELFLGDDNNYVKLPSTGGVEISSSEIGAQHYWNFGTDTTLTIPGDIQDANGSVVRVATTSTAPTRVDGQLWFNTEDGRGYIRYNNTWIDLNPTEVPSPSTYLDGLTIDGTTISAVDTTATVSIESGSNVWEFGTDGTLTLPAGYALPNTVGTAGQVLSVSTNSNVLYWTTASGGTLSSELGVVTFPGDLLIGTLWPNDPMPMGDKESVVWAKDDTEYLGLWWGGSQTYPEEFYGPVAGIMIGTGDGSMTDDFVQGPSPTGTNITLAINDDMGTLEWVFGRDGGLTFPDNTVQTTAYTGGGASLGNFAFSGNTLSNTLSNASTLQVGGNSWIFGSSGQLTFPDNTQQTTAYTGTVAYSNITGAPASVNKTSGSWILATGANTVSITVAPGGNYQMWVNGNISNGIVEWNATVNVSNPNVPVIGNQNAWYYYAGNALVLTAIPDQIIGTSGVISTSTGYVGTTSNVFSFGITNNSISTQTVYWGYTTL